MVNNYISAPDKYTNVEDFIREYTGEYNEYYETNWGMDFWFNGNEYHLARYPMESKKRRKEFEMQLGYSLDNYQFEVCINKEVDDTIFTFDGITIIGIYKDVYDLLDNCIIENRTFRDILLSDDIEVTGKD